jgi:hypothetical protein
MTSIETFFKVKNILDFIQLPNCIPDFPHIWPNNQSDNTSKVLHVLCKYEVRERKNTVQQKAFMNLKVN